jgi:hypothetical protein
MDENGVSQQLLEYIAAGYFPSASPTLRCRWGTAELNRRLGKTAAVAEDLNTGIVIDIKGDDNRMDDEQNLRAAGRRQTLLPAGGRPRTDFTCGRRR